MAKRIGISDDNDVSEVRPEEGEYPNDGCTVREFQVLERGNI